MSIGPYLPQCGWGTAATAAQSSREDTDVKDLIRKTLPTLPGIHGVIRKCCEGSYR